MPAPAAANKDALRFEALIHHEEQLLGGAGLGNEWTIADPGVADEPWVAFTPQERVGLAFSGGGIRSATFNLGVLQSLQRIRLLGHFHYLATVSGGGYIGAWWSTWLSRRPADAGLFPGFDTKDERMVPSVENDRQKSSAGTASSADGSELRALRPKDETREPDEVRHLREFSNFLSPRIGFFETEMWAAILAVISAMAPALLVAASILFVVLLAALPVALGTMSSVAPLGPIGAAVTTTLLMGFVQLVGELNWCGRRKAEEHTFPVAWWWTISITGLAAVFGASLLVSRYDWLENTHFLNSADLASPHFRSLCDEVWKHLGVEPKLAPACYDNGFFGPLGGAFTFDGEIFHAPVVWALTALVAILLPRLIALRFKGDQNSCRAFLAAADRLLQRLLGSAVVWVAVMGIWLAGAWLHNVRTLDASTVLAGAVASGGLFGLLRNWFVNQLTSSRKSSAVSRWKTLPPQLLAYLALVLAAICVAAAIANGVQANGWTFVSGALLAAAIVIGFSILFFDPAQVSMHAFYRNRLARAYLGASNPDLARGAKPPPTAATNRQVDLRRNDDCKLYELLRAREGGRPLEQQGPLHLICCAANNLSGDPLGTLGRGSRSAVLSPAGFSIGNYWRAWNPEGSHNVTVSSAITASAAAFNSNMGSVSMSLGPAVTFLMTALNLRLGLWLNHPLVTGGLGKNPGFLFLCEMLSISRAGTPVECNGVTKPTSNYVHLSDGAHFENLALYELVRRHCRYIVVTDCGADPALAFEDLANAIRRIRQDFGVDIDIDVTPLRPDPASGLSAQHMVVGAIYYNADRSDTGILLYVKPTVTGDEPPDVAHYRTRNTKFPHETTGDQFYDEAQWESYRRLGQHAMDAALRFTERLDHPSRLTAERLFADARREWYPGPPHLADRVIAATDRIAAFEQKLRDEDLKTLRRELFPELAEIERGLNNVRSRGEPRATPEPPADEAPGGAASPAEIERSLPFVLEVFRIMQSVWLSCELDRHWSHPLNLGLFNVFQRWAYAPSCRLWWPLLRAMHGDRFRRFIEEHLKLRDDDHPELEGAVKRAASKPSDGLAWMHWQRSHPRDGAVPPDARFYEYVVGLPVQQDGGHVQVVRVQLAIVALVGTNQICWNSDDFFVPPGLWDSGLAGDFLDDLLDLLKAEGADEVEVILNAPGRSPRPLAGAASTDAATRPPTRSDFSSRQQRNDLLAFYKRALFSPRRGNDEKVRLVRTFPRRPQ
jgi:hypothetical protein